MMSKQTRTRLIREGNYLAEVTVGLTETEHGWSPYLSVEDAYRLDNVRAALREQDVETAAKIGKVYILTPVEV